MSSGRNIRGLRRRRPSSRAARPRSSSSDHRSSTLVGKVSSGRYDVTAMALTGGSFSALSTVTTSDLGSATGRTLQSGVTILWDAGLLLRDRSADDRHIYTAIRTGKVLTNPLADGPIS